MEKRVVTVVLAFGRCRRLVVVAIEVSDGSNDWTDAAVGEGVITLLLDVSQLLVLKLRLLLLLMLW